MACVRPHTTNDCLIIVPGQVLELRQLNHLYAHREEWSIKGAYIMYTEIVKEP